MKKHLFYLAAVAVVAAVAFTACDKDENKEPEKEQEKDPFTYDEGVVIGNVTWAIRNVDAYQTFASKPDMYTKFYQWNRGTAWAATGEVSGWTETSITDTAWTNNPCPAGWRLPTRAEFIALDSVSGGNTSTYEGGTWAAANERGNAVAGRFYGPKHASGSLPNNMDSCLFLPATGRRINSDGSLNSQGSLGAYWSATQYGSNGGYYLLFASPSSSPSYSGSKALGFPIRCVK